MPIRALAGLWGALLLVLVGTTDGGAKADDANSLELSVKVAFLYKFRAFVIWPDTAFASPDAPFTVCVAGKHPFGQLLDRVVDRERAGDRAIVIRRLEIVSPDDHCQILYVGADDSVTAKRLQKPVAGAPVLTVTDGIMDQAAKGMINFVIKDDSVHFEIDDEAARRSGLVISSKLLSLAIKSSA